jgi:hypothetical protein
MWLNKNIENIALISGKGLKAYRVFLTILLCIDKVNGPRVYHQACRDNQRA